MNLNLEGKSVVITGGSRGIGYACALSFLQEGSAVTIIGRDPEILAEAARTLGSHPALTTVEGDLSQIGEIQRLKDVFEGADVLVNNAGAIPGGGLETVDAAAWRRAWELKVTGFVETTRVALPAMTRRGSGVIVNVIGIYGTQPTFDYLCGSAGNAALIAFTKATGGHSAKAGVRVVGLNPGLTRTDRLERLLKGRAKERFGDEARWKEVLGELPFGRLAEPTEMADLVTFLASSRASYLSGVVLDADGGKIYSN